MMTIFCELLQDMIHIADTKVARRYGDFFIRQIHKFEEVSITVYLLTGPHLRVRFNKRPVKNIFLEKKFSLISMLQEFGYEYEQIFTARKRSLRRLCLYRCLSVHRGGGIPACIAGGIPACLAEGGGGIPASLQPGGGCLQAHTGGVCIPACNEADPSCGRLLLRAVPTAMHSCCGLIYLL